MKKLSEVAKLQVMDILSGNQVARVKTIVVNPDNYDVILILNAGCITDFHYLKKQSILGFRDYITIKTPEAIISTKKAPEALEELDAYRDLIGIRVIDSCGNLLCEATDLVIDEKNWKLISILLEDGTEIEAAKILSVSNDFIFVQDGEEVEEEAAEEEDNYLVGKKLLEDTVSEDGEFSLVAGMVITPEIIAQAKEHNVYAELIMNAEE